MTVAQTAYRFGGDDGTESTHSFLAALNTPISRAATDASTFLLRILIQATGTGLTNYAPQWQYSHNGGAWTSITTTSAVVKTVTTSVFANAADATSRLGGTGTFVVNNDGCTHDGLAGGANFDITTDGRGETVASLQLVPANIAAGDVIGIRVSGVTSYSQVAMIAATPRPAFVPNTVRFDGTSDYQHYLAALAGIANTDKVTFAFTYRPTGANADQHILSMGITTGSTFRFVLGRQATTGELYLVCRNSAPVGIIDLRSTALAVDTIYSVCGSFDLSNVANRHFYVNDVASLGTVITYTVGGIIDLAPTLINRVGAQGATTPSFFYNGDLGEFWIEFGRYVDFSVEANRRLFFNASNYPVDKGPFGELPFSVQPHAYFSNPTALWHANRGRGGGFIPVGALTDGTELPVGGATVVLDTGAATAAGVDIAANQRLTLDSGAITAAGTDVGANQRPALDTGAISVAGTDITANVRPMLDTGAVSVTGADLTILEARTLTLDIGAVAVAGNDLLVSTTVVLDAAAISVIGTDLAASVRVALDTAAITIAGADVQIAQTVLLDTGAITVAGADIAPLAAGAVLLDTGAISLAGQDLTILAASVLALDTGTLNVAGADVLANQAIALDTGAITCAGNDLIPLLRVTLDIAAIAVAGNDITPLAAGAVLLDTGTITVAGTDLTVLAPSVLTLDTGAIIVAGSDVAANQRLILDTGTITATGNDLAILVASVFQLDTGAITVAGNDITPLAAGAVLLDTAAISVATTDLAANQRPILDTGAISVAGADLGILRSQLLDTGTISVSGADLTILGPFALSLDTGAIVVAGADILPQLTQFTLDTGAIAVAANDLALATAIALDSGALAAVGTDLAIKPSALLDTGAITVQGDDIVVLAGELGVFGPQQHFEVQFSPGQSFTVLFASPQLQHFEAQFGSDQAFSVLFAPENAFAVTFDSDREFEIAA